MFDKLFNYLIKSDYIKAQILAQVRHMVTALGVSLVAKGYADDSTVQACTGLAVALVGFWLANRDVKKVDEKINTALATPLPSQGVSVTTVVTAPDPRVEMVLHSESPKGLSPEQEAEETALLNKLQTLKPGV